MAGPAPHLRLIIYDKDHVDERNDIPLAEAVAAAKGPGVGWITLYDPSDDDYQILETELDLHPLALEDTRNQYQRPKVEEFPGNTYIVVRTLRRAATEAQQDDERPRLGETLSDQSNLFLGNGWVVVIHERPLGVFEEVRERIRRGRPRIRNSGADYLAYTLIDAVVDGYFPLLAQIGDEIEDVEDAIEEEHREEHLDRIHSVRRDLRAVRRTVWPMRDAVASLLRDESKGFKRNTLPFLRDVHDHTMRALDLTETHRESASALVEIYLGLMSHRTNEVMKVLTIVATIFIPLTFIAGVYGMNFEHMPELGWPWGYAVIWAVMLAVVGVELWFFRNKGWI